MSRQYSGIGRPLYKATYAGSPATALVVQPNTLIIPTSGYTDSEAIADAMNVQIVVNYNTAPAVATDVEFASEPTFTDTTVLTTLPITTDKVNVLSITAAYNGFIRIHNTSTSQINSVYLQKSDSTFG